MSSRDNNISLGAGLPALQARPRKMSAEDRAQEQELLEWERNNRVRVTATYQPEDKEYGPADCIECEEPLPKLRRAEGKKLCPTCQSFLERRQKTRGF